jgi:hypothetical protein
MTVSVYAQDIKSAQAMIKQAGQLVTWRKVVRTANNAQNWKATETTQDFQVYIFFPRKGSNAINALQRLFKGTEVTDGAPSGIMAAVTGFVPEITDKVIRGNVPMAIASIDPLAPDGNPILYFIEFK